MTRRPPSRARSAFGAVILAVALTVGCGAAVNDDSPSTGTTSDPPAGEVTDQSQFGEGG